MLTLVLSGIFADINASGQGSAEDYQRSLAYRERIRNLVFRDAVSPNWSDDNNSFWYRVETGKQTHEFVFVDAANGVRRPAFNHARLAEQLSSSTERDVAPSNLRLQALSFSDDQKQCRFRHAGEAWRFKLPDGPLAKADGATTASSNGLPGQSRVVRSHNGGDPTTICFENRLQQALDFYWVMPGGELRSYGTVAANQSEQLQTYDGHAWILKDPDGELVASFVASSSQTLAIIDKSTVKPKPQREPNRRRNQKKSPDGKWIVEFEDKNLVLYDALEMREVMRTDDGSEQQVYEGPVVWSPDSQHFVAMTTTPGMRRKIDLVESSPEDSIHSRVLTIPYAKPGDPVDHQRPTLFSQNAVKWEPRMIDDGLFPNPYKLSKLAWDESGRKFSFLYNQRGHQSLCLIEVDAATAVPRVVIDECSDTFVCYSSKSFLHRIDSSDEWIWMSERSGFNHLYLIDGSTGEVKHPITSGPWVVRRVERVDEKNRRLFLRVSGIDPEQDPYHAHLIRVDFDGSNLVRLTHGDGNHHWQFSPDERHLIDSYSRVDLPPITTLRDAHSGKLICELEQADASALLATGWRPPERFVTKGRDKATDIFGIIVRPTNFDPGKLYPVLEEIYAGPHSSFVPKDFGIHPGLYSMAELGFIVVKIDGMGTSHRSKAFHDVCWKNLADAGFPDRIAWIKAAAKERPEMDLSRVGIWGGSAGGQSAMRALIAHGDFYKAAVADCGCHDNRVDKIWWNEQWMGWPIGDHYEQQSNVTQAHRLRGDLMLIWGELDRNVDPSSTMQVIDALVRADKDFEQLIVPGAGHGAAGHPYAKRRQADFFIRKLWQREPRQE